VARTRTFPLATDLAHRGSSFGHVAQCLTLDSLAHRHRLVGVVELLEQGFDVDLVGLRDGC
jgi:hypothetical protein